MDIFNQIRQHIIAEIKRSFVIQEQAYSILDTFTVEIPKNQDHGDLSTNAAMVLAKILKQKPYDIAKIVGSSLTKYPDIINIEIAGAGFINIKLSSDILFKNLAVILEEGVDYGSNNIGHGRKINIEFVSVNPTGPMHIGHARSAVIGDALARLMQKSGYSVTKEYYVNDAGGQIDILAQSVFLRYQEVCGIKIEQIPKGLYPGEYLINVGQKIYKDIGKSLLDIDQHQAIERIKPIATEMMLNCIKGDLKLLDVNHDIFFSELALHRKKTIESVVDLLKDKGFVYQGALEIPKGKASKAWQKREQLLFKSTLFGDDSDRALRKSDGSWTYFAADIAYCYDKIKRNFDNITIFLGADHQGYVNRIKAAIRALSDNKVEANIQVVQLVSFSCGGMPMKMSKRAGNFITLADVVKEVGKDVTRFLMLTRKNDVVFDFDLSLAVEQSKDNPVFYVQYAHARINSIIKNAVEVFPDIHIGNVDYISLLTSVADMNLIKKLIQWPKIVMSATLNQEPHRIAFYLQNLAAEFHSFWHMGNENKELRFVHQDNKELTQARISLSVAVRNVIRSGFNIFNVEPVEEM